MPVATIKVMSAGAVQAMITNIGAEFERASGHRLRLHFGTAGSLRERIVNGEQTDLIVLPPASIAAFDKEGRLVPDSVVDLGRTVTGVVIKEGAPAPDISTPEAFKQALLAARSVSYTDPKAGGSSGTFFAGLIERLGIAEAVAEKAVLGKRGYEVAQIVADGRAEIGTTFISEILTVKGARALGPLPGNLHNANTYTAAIPAGSQAKDATRALLRALTDPDTRARWIEAGLEPAFAGG
jgi:molybdate transport system substrate-binding protein